MSSDTPETTDLSYYRLCCIATQGYLCHPYLVTTYKVVGIILLIVLYIGFCFGITTAIFVGSGVMSFHNFIVSGMFAATFIGATILLVIIAVSWVIIKVCIKCWRKIKHDVDRDLERARSS